jgi:hypothetical protein
MVKIPKDCHILIISFDETYDEGGIENLLINQAGVDHRLLLNLEDFNNSKKNLGLVIYVDRSSEVGRLKDFQPSFNKLKRKIAGIPTLKIRITEHFMNTECGILKIRNTPKKGKIKEIVEFVREQLAKMYKFSFDPI